MDENLFKTNPVTAQCLRDITMLLTQDADVQEAVFLLIRKDLAATKEQHAKDMAYIKDSLDSAFENNLEGIL